MRACARAGAMRAVEAAGGVWLGARVGGEGTVFCGVILPERYGRMHRVILSATLFAAALTPSARAPSSGVAVCGPGASCVSLPGPQRRLAPRRRRHSAKAALSCARIVPADAIHKGVSGKRSSVMAAAGAAWAAGAPAGAVAAGRQRRGQRPAPHGQRRLTPQTQTHSATSGSSAQAVQSAPESAAVSQPGPRRASQRPSPSPGPPRRG